MVYTYSNIFKNLHFRFPVKSQYEGDFFNGKYNGFGIFTKDKMKYEGEFSDGKVIYL